MNVIVQQLMTKRDAAIHTFSSFPFPFSQKDVRSDPKAVQEVSAATNDLLENLGALAVEVFSARAHRKLTESASLSCLFPKFSLQGLNFDLGTKSMFTKNFLYVVSLLCPSVTCDTYGGLSFFFFSFNL